MSRNAFMCHKPRVMAAVLVMRSSESPISCFIKCSYVIFTRDFTSFVTIIVNHLFNEFEPRNTLLHCIQTLFNVKEKTRS